MHSPHNLLTHHANNGPAPARLRLPVARTTRAAAVLRRRTTGHARTHALSSHAGPAASSPLAGQATMPTHPDCSSPPHTQGTALHRAAQLPLRHRLHLRGHKISHHVSGAPPCYMHCDTAPPPFRKRGAMNEPARRERKKARCYFLGSTTQSPFVPTVTPAFISLGPEPAWCVRRALTSCRPCERDARTRPA